MFSFLPPWGGRDLPVAAARLVQRYVPVLLVACVTLSVTYTPVAHSAERELKTDSKEKSDVVLLLDTSGSMLLTDPQRLRDQGAKLLLQYLRPDDRLGIIEFSNDAKVIHPLASFTADAAAQADKEISSTVSLGTYTDIYAALKAAQEMLASTPRDDANSVIILLSDGKMEPPPTGGTTQSKTDELFNALLPDLKAKNVKVYTVAFSDSADKDLLASIALGTDGINWFTPQVEQLHNSYADLFLALKKPQFVPLTSKGFHVDENVEEITFYVSRDQQSALELTSPSGVKFSKTTLPAGAKWFSGERFDVITIPAPQSGDWQVVGLAPEEGFATILTNLKLRTDFPASVAAQSDVVVQARLYDGEKPVSLPGMSGVTQFGLQVIPSDQVATPIIRILLNDEGKNGDLIKGDGIFSGTVAIERAGEYKVRVVAQSQTFTRSQQLPFRVKPPLIELQVEKRVAQHDEVGEDEEGGSGDHAHDEHGGGGAGHGGGHEETNDPSVAEHGVAEHGVAEHGVDKHAASETETGVAEDSAAIPAKEEPAHEAAAHESKPHDLDAEELEDILVIKLSEEAAKLKDLELKLIAVNSKKERFELPLKKIVNREDKSVRFEFASKLLPAVGKYELQAFISGESRSGLSMKGKSKLLVYTVTHTDEDASVVSTVAEKNRKKVKKESTPLLGFLLIFLVNGAVAGLGIIMIKKAAKNMRVEAPRATDPLIIEKMITDLELKADLSTVDLNDPMFSKNAEEIPSSKAKQAEAPTAGGITGGAVA